MENKQIEFLEERMSCIAKMAVLFQCIAATFALSILYFRPDDFRNIGQTFSSAALIASFIISKTYIYTGKKLETLKTFSEDEIAIRKQEYFRKFFFAYGLWPLFYGIFYGV